MKGGKRIARREQYHGNQRQEEFQGVCPMSLTGQERLKRKETIWQLGNH